MAIRLMVEALQTLSMATSFYIPYLVISTVNQGLRFHIPQIFCVFKIYSSVVASATYSIVLSSCRRKLNILQHLRSTWV